MAKKKVKKTAAKKKTAKTTKSTKSSSDKSAPKPAVKKTARTAGKSAPTKAVRKTAAVKKVKKVSPQAAAPKEQKARRRRPKSVLSKTELQHFRERLIEKLKEIIGDVDHIESEALKRSRLDATGDLSSMPIHMADIGSDNYEQEFALGLMHSERKLVQEIHAALKRIDEGSYGICEGTGEPIPKPRLEGIPWARYCVEYAEKLEKGLVSEEDRWLAYDEFASDRDEETDEETDSEDEEDDIEETEDNDDLFYYGYDDDDDDEEDLV